MPETHTHTPDWNGVCLLLAACWHSQVLQRATFNSLWTDAFVSWSSNLCANDKTVLHLCICICKYRYIDETRGYLMNFWPFLIFDTRANPPQWVWSISLQAQPVAYFHVCVFKWVYVRCWCHILVFWGFWLLCLKYYINAPVPISYIFFDDIFRWFAIQLCCVPLLPFATCYFVCTDSAIVCFSNLLLLPILSKLLFFPACDFITHKVLRIVILTQM